MWWWQGAGRPGLGAAYTAAKRGAKVLLIEKSGRLGGMAVQAMVSPFSLSVTSPIAQTLAHEIGMRHSVDFAGADVRAYDLLTKTGAEILLYALVLGPVMEGTRVTGVRVQCAEGPLTFGAKVVIDATGDGDVAAAAGIPYEIGRKEDGLMQPMSIMFTVGGIEPGKRFSCYSEEHARVLKLGGRTWEEIVLAAVKAGELPPEVGVIRLYPAADGCQNVVNATQVNRLNGTKSADLMRAEIVCRKQAFQIVNVLRKNLPGYAKCAVATMPAVIGVRETRRFEGVKRLLKEDCLAGRKCPDAIARDCSFVIDIHNPTGAGHAVGRETTATGQAERVKPYDIPYGALVPKAVDGLLFCGRCLSADHEALASCRVMGNAMATGVGAGAAAAYAVQNGIDLRNVPPEMLNLFSK